MPPAISPDPCAQIALVVLASLGIPAVPVALVTPAALAGLAALFFSSVLLLPAPFSLTLCATPAASFSLSVLLSQAKSWPASSLALAASFFLFILLSPAPVFLASSALPVTKLSLFLSL